MLSATILRRAVDYDSNTGLFCWRYRPEQSPQWNGRFADSNAGSRHPDGRNYITINRKRYGCARLAWLYVTGEWPNNNIDHRNGDCGDDRFCNLRDATQAENLRNRGKDRDNTSGYKGVYWHALRQKWAAQIGVDGRRVYLGIFSTAESAAEAYAAAAHRYHGDFARIL